MTIETPPPALAAPASRLAAVKATLAKPMVLVGIGGACLLGLTLGLLARPTLAPDSRAEGSMQPVDQMQIVIDRNEPLPAVEGGKLELLPAGLMAPRAESPTDPTLISEAEPAPAPVRQAAQGPSFDCADTASASEELVCNDAALAAQDRRLAASWRRALDAGVPMNRLRRQQQRWLDAREDAARHAPQEVADLYDQRIQELDEVAAYER